ncbi:gp53-like domain-containing protein [Rhizobium cremeum]|uniref:gp53-like domain-containing protein n=1 Tax=Rhizobium cremeum TaxID=2813827 RepID=UPI0039E1DEEA
MKYYPPYGSTDPDASYVDRYSVGATSGSKVPAKALEVPQREIVDVIEKSGLTPDDVLQLAAAIQSGGLNYAVAGGTANALTATLSQVPDALVAGMEVSLKVVAANTSTAVTLNLNGLGPVTVYRPFEDALKPGDIGIGINTFRYDGTYWRLVGQANVISGDPASRWTKLSNGLIMQWGTVTTSASSVVTVTFPIVFPTAVASVVISDTSSPVIPGQLSVFTVGSVTTSSFQVVSTRDFSTAVADIGNWIAMGY